MRADYLLYHDAVDAHVYVAPGEVEQVHPAESKTQHKEAQVLVPPFQIQPSRDEEEEALEEAVKRSNCDPAHL